MVNVRHCGTRFQLSLRTRVRVGDVSRSIAAGNLIDGSQSISNPGNMDRVLREKMVTIN